ncbi:MAG: transcriptional regulator [Chlorobiaceae bacterium]|nr:transcriptional regulator [Chlorobiaceae bacterium]
MDFGCQFVCELRELSPAPALMIRMHTSMHDIARLFDAGYREIVALLATQGRKPAGAPFARYFNMDSKMIDIEFGFPVESDVQGGGRIAVGATPCGKAVTSLFIGPYNEIEPAYDALMKWADDNGYSPSGEAYEIYLNDPTSIPSDQLRTQVHLMLRES